MMAATVADLAQVERDLECSGELLKNFFTPWDADDTRPLCTLKDALEIQQRAIASLFRIVEQEQQYRRALSQRMDRREYRS
jgi:hypothetical protein